MINPSAEAFTRRGIEERGLWVLFQRVSGFSPNTSTFSARVMASVSDVANNTEEPSQTGYGATQPGGISQDDRQIIVMEEDLRTARFPLPVAKNDKVIVEVSGEKFNITRANAYKRKMAGAIEIVATGVA